MKVLVTARHTDVSEDIRTRAQELVERAAKKAGRVIRAEVILDVDHDRFLVEYHLHFAKGRTKMASAEGSDFRTALDRGAHKLENHLDKTRPSTNRRIAS